MSIRKYMLGLFAFSLLSLPVHAMSDAETNASDYEESKHEENKKIVKKNRKYNPRTLIQPKQSSGCSNNSMSSSDSRFDTESSYYKPKSLSISGTYRSSIGFSTSDAEIKDFDQSFAPLTGANDKEYPVYTDTETIKFAHHTDSKKYHNYVDNKAEEETKSTFKPFEGGAFGIEADAKIGVYEVNNLKFDIGVQAGMQLSDSKSSHRMTYTPQGDTEEVGFKKKTTESNTDSRDDNIITSRSTISESDARKEIIRQDTIKNQFMLGASATISLTNPENESILPDISGGVYMNTYVIAKDQAKIKISTSPKEIEGSNMRYTLPAYLLDQTKDIEFTNDKLLWNVGIGATISTKFAVTDNIAFNASAGVEKEFSRASYEKSEFTRELSSNTTLGGADTDVMISNGTKQTLTGISKKGISFKTSVGATVEWKN